MSKILKIIKRQIYVLKSKLWFKPAAYCVIATLAIYFCYLFQKIGINFYSTTINKDTVTTLLSIITNSMIAAMVFAVGAIVTAYTSASQSGTPRVLSILLRDSTSHKATSTFIGAFIYGVVATIGLKSGIFNQTGIFLIFIITILVFIWIILTFIVWIDNIAKLGQIKTILQKTEKQAFSTVKQYTKNPYMYCNKLDKERIPEEALPIYSDYYGFLNEIHLELLNNYCEKLNAKLYIVKYKGEHLASSEIIAYIKSPKYLSKEMLSKITDNFIISNEKNFIEDPIFGVETLSEIAAKALSPGTNDPGTAISVIDSLNRCLKYLIDHTDSTTKVIYKNIYVEGIEIDRFIKSGFEYIRIYGSNNLQVAKRIQKSLLHISKQLENDNSINFIKGYLSNCLAQANNELKYDFEKKDLKIFTDKLKNQK